MLMCKMQSHFKAIKNILNTLKQFLKKVVKFYINAIMNDMGMTIHYTLAHVYAECIKFHAISTFLK